MAVVRHALRALRGRDLALWGAGVAFFTALGIVPALLLGLRGVAVLFGGELVTSGIRLLGEALPEAQPAAPALQALADAALTASWPALLSSLLAACLCGEGLRRGFIQVAGLPSSGKTGWLGRLGFLPALAVSPLLLALGLALAPQIAPDYGTGGWNVVRGVLVSFHLVWVLLSVVLFLVFVSTGPNALDAPTAATGAISTAAVLSGFLHGFVLFLAIPVDWAFPFAGLRGPAVASALGLWLYLLHVVLLLCYRVLLSARSLRSPTTG
ncbi:YhjD/YihY/BrkB family envelope integrity protein [Actinosynnema sp. NPDC000082]|uniref:YhjD/YihY/BrkB family envelope integrity protein n=1 Tax=Actinosynnema sp. NPDC000082 TaxID=3363910 RepID=UPI0020A5C51C